MGKWREFPKSGLQSSYWLNHPLIGQQPILVVFPHIDCWLKHLLIGLQLLLIWRPSYWLKCQTTSDWSTTHPSPITLLLHNTHSDWSTAHPSLKTLIYPLIGQRLITFLLENCHLVCQQLFLVLQPSYWLNHPLIGQQLLLVLQPSFG